MHRTRDIRKYSLMIQIVRWKSKLKKKLTRVPARHRRIQPLERLPLSFCGHINQGRHADDTSDPMASRTSAPAPHPDLCASTAGVEEDARSKSSTLQSWRRGLTRLRAMLLAGSKVGCSDAGVLAVDGHRQGPPPRICTRWTGSAERRRRHRDSPWRPHYLRWER